jgi:FkbH-like protein
MHEAAKITGGEARYIKCLVWDLDNTIWDGVLLEGDKVCLRDGVAETIKALDSRGIIQSVASKNDHDLAMGKLREFKLAEYFLYPQINWNSKSSSISEIVKSINIGQDAVAFIDDQEFELDEVNFSLPQVLTIRATSVVSLLDMPEMNPRFITEDASLRRLMYLSDAERNNAEAQFKGPKEEFLSTVNMTFTITRARDEDLKRAEELTVRTHQLNTTGYAYSYEELDYFRQSPEHLLLIASLEDRYGTYGKIGLALVERKSAIWTIKLLLMSCRVMARGVGTILLNHLMSLASEAKARLRADFIPNSKNRMMRIAYNFAGFREVARDGDLVILETDFSHIQPCPDYIDLKIVE